MIEMHWSKPYLNWLTIEITYSDNSRQGWDYDCIQYPSFEALKLNMTNDFEDSRPDRVGVMVYASKPGEDCTVDLEDTENTGEDFMNEVFDSLDTFLNEVIS